MYWYGPAIGYHEGDPLPGDGAIPQRPDPTYDWNGTAWVQNAARLAAAQALSAQMTAIPANLATALADPTVQYLLNNTPAQCAAQVATMVTDLPSAVNMFQRMATVLCVLVQIAASDYGK